MPRVRVLWCPAWTAPPSRAPCPKPCTPGPAPDFSDSFGNAATGKGQGGEVPIKIFSHLHRAVQQEQENWSQVDFGVRGCLPCHHWQRFGDTASQESASLGEPQTGAPSWPATTPAELGSATALRPGGFFLYFFWNLQFFLMPCWRKNIGPNGGLCTGFGVRPVNFYKKIQTLIPFYCFIPGSTAVNTKKAHHSFEIRNLSTINQSPEKLVTTFLGRFFVCLSILKIVDYITRHVGINSSCNWNAQGKNPLSWILKSAPTPPHIPIETSFTFCYWKHTLKTFTSQALLL